MRKTKQKNVADKKVKGNNNSSKTADSARGLKKLDSIDDDDLGFGGWLRSPQGLDNMKLFVIANSLVLLTTLALPHMQSVVEIIVQIVFGGDY